IGERGHRGNGIGSLQHAWLQTPGEGTRRPAFRVKAAAISTANLTAPRADPGILVIEDERDIETAFEHRPEHRRIGWVERDEKRIERAGAMQRPGGAAKPWKRAQTEVSETKTARHVRGYRPSANDLERRRHQPAELRVDAPFIILLG